MRACAGKTKTLENPHAAPHRARSTHARRTGTRRTAPPPAPPAAARAGGRERRCTSGTRPVMRSWSAHSDRAVRPACRPRCPTGRFEDERLSSCVDELMRLYRAVWRAGVSSHARRPPGCVAGGTSPGSRVVASITICLHCSSSCSNSQTSTRCSNNRSNTRCSNSQSNNRLRNKRSNAADGRHCP